MRLKKGAVHEVDHTIGETVEEEIGATLETAAEVETAIGTEAIVTGEEGAGAEAEATTETATGTEATAETEGADEFRDPVHDLTAMIAIADVTTVAEISLDAIKEATLVIRATRDATITVTADATNPEITGKAMMAPTANVKGESEVVADEGNEDVAAERKTSLKVRITKTPRKMKVETAKTHLVVSPRTTK